MVALQRSLSQPSKVGCCIFQHGPLSSVLFVFLLVSSPSSHTWNVSCLKAESLTWSLLCPQQWTVGPSSCGHLHVVRCVDSLAPGLNQRVCTTSLMWTGWFLKRPTLFSCESSGQNAICARLVEKEYKKYSVARITALELRGQESWKFRLCFRRSAALLV